MVSSINVNKLTCTQCFLLSGLAAIAHSLVRTAAVGTFWPQIPGLLGGPFPGWMLLRTERTAIFRIWTLSLYMPIPLALLAHLRPSFFAIRPIGERMGMPDRPLMQGVVRHRWIGELDDE